MGVEDLLYALYVLLGIVIAFVALAFLASGLVVLRQFERGVVFRWGRLETVLGPGLHFLTPVSRTVVRVDLRTKTIDIPAQEVLTKDNVPVKIDAVIYVQVGDAAKSVVAVEKWDWALLRLGQGVLRSVLGTHELDEVLQSMERVAGHVEKEMREHIAGWGIRLEGVQIHDIVLPGNMKRILARVAEAERERRSLQIDADGEMLAADKMAKAAERLSSVKGGLHLRTLLTLYDIAAEPSNKIVIMLPSEALKAFEGFAALGEEAKNAVR
ncbi:MAG TPA: SPFH domain-containing protein [Thermoplasmata archaeon]|nr:SPFH domain-containing protein [Thermoplasmata archaeon]